MKFNSLDRIINKFTSGRFLLTIILALVYAYMAITNKLNDYINSTFMLIISFYFSKQRVEEKEDNSNDKTGME